MKKVFVAFALLSIFSLKSIGQHIKPSAVPPAVRTSFEKAYPGVAASWEKEGKDYEVGFKQNGHDISVLYHNDGTLSETEQSIKGSELPSLVKAELNKRYKGKAVKEYAMITKADGEINYEAEIDGKDVLFTPDGKFVKEAKD
jgi:hypothetical protein